MDGALETPQAGSSEVKLQKASEARKDVKARLFLVFRSLTTWITPESNFNHASVEF